MVPQLPKSLLCIRFPGMLTHALHACCCLQLSAEVNELKRQVESLQAANTALSTAAEQNQQQAASAAAAAASADAEANKQAMQAAQERQAQLQELLADAVSQLEKLHESRSQEQTELDRWICLMQPHIICSHGVPSLLCRQGGWMQGASVPGSVLLRRINTQWM